MQNPQAVLQKHEVPEEDYIWTRAYKDNPQPLDFSMDDEEERAIAKTGGTAQHCPRCGKKICSCGYMLSLKRGRSGGEDEGPPPKR